MPYSILFTYIFIFSLDCQLVLSHLNHYYLMSRNENNKKIIILQGTNRRTNADNFIFPILHFIRTPNTKKIYCKILNEREIRKTHIPLIEYQWMNLTSRRFFSCFLCLQAKMNHEYLYHYFIIVQIDTLSIGRQHLKYFFTPFSQKSCACNFDSLSS